MHDSNTLLRGYVEAAASLMSDICEMSLILHVYNDAELSEVTAPSQDDKEVYK